ncbi:MAG: carbohydrate kinase [Muribaculaceae bacterium]|nr:carbohydrate kinase [Muribaculaceae bacterium]
MNSQAKLPAVVGIGEVLWDLLPEGKKLGGAPANFAYHVSQFGLNGCAVSAIGADALGAEILEILNSKSVDHLIAEQPYPTGTVEVELTGAGIPRYDIKENAAWDHIPFTSALEALAARTRAVCFGSLAQRAPESRQTIRRFLDALPAGALKVFDINLRQHFYTAEIIEESMRRCNILKINDEELLIVSDLFALPDGDYKERCREIRRRFGLDLLILTCGVDGSYVFSSDEELFQPTQRVEVADTVGAGDSFTAAFIASLLQGRNLADAHRRAVEVSAYVCSQNGAMPLLPPALTQ